jgi:hypothetical protein
MLKNPLMSAIYHGTNSFAKENYCETIHAGFGGNRSLPDNRGASKYGRWQSRAHRLHHLGLRRFVDKLGRNCGGFLS